MMANRFFMAALAALFLVAMAARAQEFPKPGPEHELLKQMEGSWAAKMKVYMTPENAQESAGEYTAKMEVGGLFLVGEVKGKMLGADFHGKSISGYDPFKKKYTGTWVDNMSPALYSLEGSWDKSGKIYTEILEGPNPGSGEKMTMRMVTEIKDKDTLHQKMYGTPPGEQKERVVIEMNYTRKK
jgi:hypothetical protein